ncbi:MAG: ribonuclease P protein subunit [Candidatus Hermodarchaeota archaeon]
MMIDPKFLIYHDLIGFYALAKPKSKSDVNKFSCIGIIIDETRDMLITELNNKLKKYIKKDYIFRFELPQTKDDEVEHYLEVEGNKIIGLPVNRLRSLKKKRWLKI